MHIGPRDADRSRAGGRRPAAQRLQVCFRPVHVQPGRRHIRGPRTRKQPREALARGRDGKPRGGNFHGTADLSLPQFEQRRRKVGLRLVDGGRRRTAVVEYCHRAAGGHALAGRDQKPCDVTARAREDGVAWS